MQNSCEWCRLGACIYAQMNRRYRTNTKGHRYYRTSGLGDIKGRTCVALKKPSSPGPTSVGSTGVPCVFSATHPSLSEWMTEEKWEDSSRRLLPSLTVFVEDGLTKLCLNDKAVGRVCFVSGPSLADALVRAEEGLLLETLDWRKSKALPGRK